MKLWAPLQVPNPAITNDFHYVPTREVLLLVMNTLCNKSKVYAAHQTEAQLRQVKAASFQLQPGYELTRFAPPT